MRPDTVQFKNKAHRSSAVRLFPYALMGIGSALLVFCLITSISFASKPVAIIPKANRALSSAVAAVSPAPAVLSANPAPTALPEKKQTNSTLINLNTATAEELQTLPGIGKALSQAIIDYRTTVAPFQTVEDVKRVKGIGEKRFDAIRNLICTE